MILKNKFIKKIDLKNKFIKICYKKLNGKVYKKNSNENLILIYSNYF